MRLEIERPRKFLVARVGQLVGEAIVVGDAFGQNLANERFGIGHVLQPVRLQRIAIDTVVRHEFVDRFDVADSLTEIGGFARNEGFLRNARDRTRQIGSQQSIAGECRGHSLRDPRSSAREGPRSSAP
jgi:hypothetical protein